MSKVIEGLKALIEARVKQGFEKEMRTQLHDGWYELQFAQVELTKEKMRRLINEEKDSMFN